MGPSASNRLPPTNRDVFAIAWPLAIKASMLHGIIVIDGYLVSSLGEDALASLGIAGAIAGLLLGFIFAFSSAAQIRVAQAFGSKDPRLLKSVLLCSLSINLAILTAGLLAIWAVADHVLLATAATPRIAADAQSYLAAFSLVFVAEAISQSIGSYFNGCGRTHVPLISYAVALPANVLISYGFIHGSFGLPELGIVGAAIGTSVAACLRLGLVGTWLLRTQMRLLLANGWQGQSFGAAFRIHLLFTLPIATTFVSMGIANHVSILIYSQMDVLTFAAMTIILPWIQVGGTIAMSWAQATGILAAQLLGRKADERELDRFLSSAWRAVFLSALPVSLLLAGISLGTGSIYPQLQQETLATASSFLPVLLVLPFIKCTNAVCGNTLRAAGDTVYVMNLFLGSVWLFRVPLLAIIVLWVEASAIWIMVALLLEEAVKFPWFHLRIFAGKWKTANVLSE
jgi:Na+-driven multidrug efflux pump